MKKRERDALIEIATEKLYAAIGGANRTIVKNLSAKSYSKTFVDFIYPYIHHDISGQVKTKANISGGLVVFSNS